MDGGNNLLDVGGGAGDVDELLDQVEPLELSVSMRSAEPTGVESEGESMTRPYQL